VTLPVPASTEPAADAAAHIAALADAIGTRLSSRSAAYWAGPVTTNGSGDFIIPGLAGVLSWCAGAVVADNANLTTAHLFTFRGAGAPGVAYVRVNTLTGGGFGAGTLNVCLTAWGTPA
jgi:hypothetical protein